MANLSFCPLCRNKDFESLFKKGSRRFVKCPNDGLVFIAPQPSAKELHDLYNERYFETEEFRGKTCIGYYAYIDERPLLLEYFDRKVNLIKKYTKKRKALDIGCGHGFFLEVAKKRGLEVTGIDISGYAVEYAKKHGQKALLTDIYKAGFKDNSFDVATAFQLIEHIPNLVRFMKEVKRILQPGGFVFLTTPNYAGYLRRLMGRNWFSYRHQEHLFFFSPKSMKYLLEKAGFTSVKFSKDETRFYPLRHILGGVKYYFKGNFFSGLAELSGNIFDKLNLLDLRIPFPLDTLVIVAQKSKK